MLRPEDMLRKKSNFFEILSTLFSIVLKSYEKFTVKSKTHSEIGDFQHTPTGNDLHTSSADCFQCKFLYDDSRRISGLHW